VRRHQPRSSGASRSFESRAGWRRTRTPREAVVAAKSPCRPRSRQPARLPCASPRSRRANRGARSRRTKLPHRPGPRPASARAPQSASALPPNRRWIHALSGPRRRARRRSYLARSDRGAAAPLPVVPARCSPGLRVATRGQPRSEPLSPPARDGMPVPSPPVIARHGPEPSPWLAPCPRGQRSARGRHLRCRSRPGARPS